jgi:hypothetical protein
MTERADLAAAAPALRVGGFLVLDIFKAWRRDLACIDALILLAISRANVDGILYSRDLRARYGSPSFIAPDSIRQPVSVSILALTLGFPEHLIRRHVASLAARDECAVTPEGMLITAERVEAIDRLGVRLEIYRALRLAYVRLQELGFVDALPLPPPAMAAEPPVRSAGAHAAKYVLRVLASLAWELGDLVDALILLEVVRQAREEWRHPGRPATIREVAAALGLSPNSAGRRVGRLVSEGWCVRTPRGVEPAADLDGLAVPVRRNLEHLYQLLAGLAEVGALASFEAGAERAVRP